MILTENKDVDLGINPFLESLIIPTYSSLLQNEFTKDESGKMIQKEVILDKTPKSFIFILPEYRKRINKLTNSGKSLYLWLIYELETNEEYIWINKVRYMNELNISSIDTYKSGISDLIKNAILINTYIKDIYWINPNLLFRGNRVKQFPNNLI